MPECKGVERVSVAAVHEAAHTVAFVVGARARSVTGANSVAAITITMPKPRTVIEAGNQCRTRG